MSKFTRFFFLATAAVVVIVAASQALPQPSPSRAASATLPPPAPAQTVTPAPTKTTFIFPTLGGSSMPTTTPWPPSDTPVPPTVTPSITPSDTPLPPTLTVPVTASPVMPATEPLTPLPGISDAATTVTYTVMISNVYGRRIPDLDSNLYRSLKRGQSYTVTAQSPDGIWLSLELPQGNPTVWVPAAFGRIYGSRQAGPFDSSTQAAVSEPVSLTVEPTPSVPVYPYLSGITIHARDIYRYGLLLSNNPHAFIKIGDCQTTYPFFLTAFDNPNSYHLGDTYAYLQPAVQQFSRSFSRNSVAAQTGFGTATVLDPQWANPNVCRPGESPLVCEYRTMRPSLAIISLGTNDIWQPDGRHERNMRQILDYLIHQGVVPILSTKADNVEGDGSFNRLMVQLADEYQLPLWDFWQVTRSLPQDGLVDNYHLSWGPAVFDDPKNMLLAWPWRNLTGLQALDAVWREVR